MTYVTSKATEPSPLETNAKENSANSALETSAMQTQLSCLLEGRSPAERDCDRAQILSHFNLLATDAIPVFDEATQTVSRLLAMPICMLSVMDAELQRFKSVVGLSSLGLMNQLAAARSIPRVESFCTHVIDSGKTFSLEDATAHPAFSKSLLVQQYGIQSYLGVPLFASGGQCIGTLAVMDLLPHCFTEQEAAFLELTARWCMSEFEQQHTLAALKKGTHALQSVSGGANGDSGGGTLLSKINQVRFDLIVQLTQDLRNPLTSITGMANMLSREIYGPLSEKQQEYANIVLSSSQQLLGMVDEIVDVGDLKEDNYKLVVAATDIEMLGQQAIGSLASLAQQQDLKIKLTVEPGSRIWNLDKRVVKQLIYHLVFSIIKMSTAGSTIRLHVSRKDQSISIALWVSNPWLGEDLPQAVISWEKNNLPQAAGAPQAAGISSGYAVEDDQSGSTEVFEALATAQKVDASRQELGLLLSRHLTEMHGGQAHVQGSAATGYRYIITLPSLPLPA